MPLDRPAPRLRPHQRQLLTLVEAIAAGDPSVRGIEDVLAAVTPGGGKSLLPVIAAARLIAAGVVERVVWIVPRDSLRLQAEEAFADPVWREALGHDLSVRAAGNAPDPARGLAGYVTTYQAIAAAPELHRREAEAVPTLVVTDEVHHVPALSENDEGDDEEKGGGPRMDSPEGMDADGAGPLFAPPRSMMRAAARPNSSDRPPDDASAWSAALAPVLAAARLRLHLSGTLERADGRAILGLPYKSAKGRKAREGQVREVDLQAPGWRVIGYSRAQALRDKAVLPVTFGALDGMATWSVPASKALPDEAASLEAEARISGTGQRHGPRDGVGDKARERPVPDTGRGGDDPEPARITVGPHSLSAPFPCETTRPALFTALRTQFADALLRRAFEAARGLRAERGMKRLGTAGTDRSSGGASSGADATLPLPPASRDWVVGDRGLGKLLIVAPDQALARSYLATVRSWLPPGVGEREAMLATSSERDAHETIAAFRLLPSPSILVTVAMAYEGLDAPEVSVIACLTHIRSRPWLEQMIARATRVDPHAGPVEMQRALVFHPDDPLFAAFRKKVETEQGTRSRSRGRGAERCDLPLWLAAELAEQRADRVPEIVPIESRAMGLWFGTLAPGPEMKGTDTRLSPRADASSRKAGAASGTVPPPRFPGAPPLDAPSLSAASPSRRERELRVRLADAIAAQAVKDEAADRAERDRRASKRRGEPDEGAGPVGAGAGAKEAGTSDLFGHRLYKPKRRPRPPKQLSFGPHRTHRYNAILKRVLGKARGEMTLAELEAALAWLERNRLADHAGVLEGDEQYAWAIRTGGGRAKRTAKA